MLHSLHWLPVEQRIEYKLSLLCFKIISRQAHIYFSERLHLYTPSRRQLRSYTDTRMFRIPSFRTKSSGQRSFSYQAPCFCLSFYLCQFFQIFLENLFSKNFFSVPLPWCAAVCVFVCVCVCVRACVRACVRVLCFEF